MGKGGEEGYVEGDEKGEREEGGRDGGEGFEWKQVKGSQDGVTSVSVSQTT